MICSNCGTENKAGDKFCEQCGSPLNAADVPVGVGGSFGATVVAAPAEPCVLVRLDGSGGEPYVLGSRAVIGRLDTCDLPVDDKSVSREHARLSRLRDGYVIEDLGSTNGTLVNGRRIDEAVILRPGDIVTIGSVDFRFDLERSQRESAAAAPAEETPAWDAGATAFTPWSTDEPVEEPATPAWSGSESAPEVAATAPDESRGPDITFPPLEPLGPLPEAEADEPPPIPKFQEAYSAPEAPAEPEPATNGSQAAEVEMVPEPEAALPVPAEPDEPVVASVGGVDETSEMAEQLTGFIHDLTTQLRQTRQEQRRTQERLDSLQNDYEAVQARLQTLQDADQTRTKRLQTLQDEHNQLMSSIRSEVERTPPQTVEEDQMQELRSLLESLVQHPKDIDYLTQTAQQSGRIAGIVNEAIELRSILDAVRGHLES